MVNVLCDGVGEGSCVRAEELKSVNATCHLLSVVKLTALISG